MRIIHPLIIVMALIIYHNALGADIAAGKEKAAVCSACHGSKGISSSPLYPNLAGQKAAYLAKQLHAFKQGSRKETSMNIFTRQLSDTDIDNLAAYFESLSPTNCNTQEITKNTFQKKAHKANKK